MEGRFPAALLRIFAGLIVVYALIFMTGYWLYGNFSAAILAALAALAAAGVLLKQGVGIAAGSATGRTERGV